MLQAQNVWHIHIRGNNRGRLFAFHELQFMRQKSYLHATMQLLLPSVGGMFNYIIEAIRQHIVDEL
jgi:hypothetical protein